MKHFPNIITLSRLALLPFLFYFISLNTLYYFILSFFIFLVCLISDYLDGLVARRLNLTSDFGKFLDATTDKLFFAAIFIYFFIIGTLSSEWFLLLFVVNFLRDSSVTYYRCILIRSEVYLGASSIAKLKTLFQFLFLISIFVIFFLNEYTLHSTFYLYIVSFIIYLISVLLGLYSAFLYFKTNKKNNG